MVSAHAPAALEILGNHTSYNEGLALTCALQFGVTIEGDRRDGDRVVLRHDASGQQEEFSLHQLAKNPQRPWSNPVKGVLQQLIRYQIPVLGFEAVLRNDLPDCFDPEDDALTAVAAAVFLQRLFPFEAQPSDLARLCMDAEVSMGRSYCTLLGPLTSLTARRDSVCLLDFRSLGSAPIPLPQTHRLVVCDSGNKNLLINAKIKTRRDQCAEALRTILKRVPEARALRDINPVEMQKLAGEMNEYVFRTVMHVATENQRVREAVEALQQGDIRALAATMNLSHLSSRQSIENSTPRLDRIVEFAKSLPGFAGSRLTGPGFGGLTVHLVLAEHAGEFARTLAEAFGHDSVRSTPAFVVEPSDGAAAA